MPRAPLAKDNIKELKKQLKWDYDESFIVPDEVKKHIDELKEVYAQEEKQWADLYSKYQKAYPELAKLYETYKKPVDGRLFDDGFYEFEDKAVATRVSSNQVLNKLSKFIPNLMGGSADLAPANNSQMADRAFFSAEDRTGTNIHFGIREFAMAAISNGMALHGGIVPYCATFLVFSDYMKPAMRMSALMKLGVTYVLTHDSIGVGEDGPTHEPIEHLAALRATPGINLWRPADARETAAAYSYSVTAGCPNAIALSRQNLPQLEGTGKNALRGGYVLRDTDGAPDAVIIATGSEVSLAVESAGELAKKGVKARVVSMPCQELFDGQDEKYRQDVLPCGVPRVAVEAATSFGWAKYVGIDGGYVTIDHFGASAPGGTLFQKFGFTVDNVVKTVESVIKK